MYKFKFADIGEGLHEGVVGQIYKKEGDTVAEGDSLFSVETDKVTSDIPAPVNGTIKKVYMATGDTIHVGDIIYDIDDDSTDTPEETKETKEEVKPEVEKKESAASVVGSIEVSDKLFSNDMFKNIKPIMPKKTQQSQVSSKNSKRPTSNTQTSSVKKIEMSSFKPIGNGENVDVVVIGAGPGGYTVGEFMAHNGYKVVVVEKEYAGGVCLNVGCIPTKALLKSAKVSSYIKHAQELGVDVEVGKLSYNWAKMQERKNAVANRLAKGIETLIKGAGAKYIEGEAKIIDRWNVEVNGTTYTTKTIIMATGSEPIIIPIDGVQEGIKAGAIIDSTGALSVEKIPESLVVVGGGVIGSEFAMLYNELGTKVTILEGSPSILGPMDGEVKKEAHKIFANVGIEIITNAKVIGWKDGATLYEVNGEKKSIKSEKMLLSVGRRPVNMGVDKTLGVKLGKRGEILTDENMRTNIDNVFAIGDVVGKVMLAHTAYKHAHVVVDSFEGRPINFSWDKIPSAVYTYPEISMIGKTEEQLKAEGIDYVKSVWKNEYVGKIVADGGDLSGFTKLLISKPYGEILGAHIINANSSDMISEIAAVMELEGTIFELAATIHPHPSIAEGIYEAAVQGAEMLRKLQK